MDTGKNFFLSPLKKIHPNHSISGIAKNDRYDLSFEKINRNESEMKKNVTRVTKTFKI